MPGNVPGSGSVSREPSSISSSLLVRLKAHQPEAWQRLAELYGPVVFHWCLRANLQGADAEDVVQEVFRTVADKVASFRREREGDTFRGWLWTVTRNKIGDHIRRNRRQPSGSGGSDAHAEIADVAAESSSFEIGGLYREVLRAIEGEFQPSTWDAFWQTVVEGLAPAIVAERLEISTNAVYLAKSRVLRRIREELGDAIDE